MDIVTYCQLTLIRLGKSRLILINMFYFLHKILTFFLITIEYIIIIQLIIIIFLFIFYHCKICCNIESSTCI